MHKTLSLNSTKSTGSNYPMGLIKYQHLGRLALVT
jgi:hypothetical protein